MENLTPAESIKQAEGLAGMSIDHYDLSPLNNPDVISILKLPDGSYKGWMQKNGKLIEERQIKPEDVLISLLTHG